jgi:Fe-S-cluster containining protein
LDDARFARLSTWVPHKPSLCRGCYAACCRLPVEVSAADLVRLGVVTPDEVVGSLKKVARRLGAAGVIKQFRAATGIFTLAQTLAGDCINHDPKTRMCRVYERRPTVCRDFPTRLGPRPGFCPAYHQTPATSAPRV